MMTPLGLMGAHLVGLLSCSVERIHIVAGLSG